MLAVKSEIVIQPDAPFPTEEIRVGAVFLVTAAVIDFGQEGVAGIFVRIGKVIELIGGRHAATGKSPDETLTGAGIEEDFAFIQARTRFRQSRIKIVVIIEITGAFVQTDILADGTATAVDSDCFAFIQDNAGFFADTDCLVIVDR